MKKAVKLIEINKLRAHEQVCPKRLIAVMDSIQRQGRINNPVIIDKKYRIILDGHHRVESLRRLGCRLVPAMLVDYFSDQVKVLSRRQDFKISKQIVVNKALIQDVFPQKTTKHLIKNRVQGVKISLNQLQ